MPTYLEDPSEAAARVAALVQSSGAPPTAENFNRAAMYVAQGQQGAPPVFDKAMERVSAAPTPRQARQAPRTDDAALPLPGPAAPDTARVNATEQARSEATPAPTARPAAGAVTVSDGDVVQPASASAVAVPAATPEEAAAAAGGPSAMQQVGLMGGIIGAGALVPRLVDTMLARKGVRGAPVSGAADSMRLQQRVHDAGLGAAPGAPPPFGRRTDVAQPASLPQAPRTSGTPAMIPPGTPAPVQGPPAMIPPSVVNAARPHPPLPPNVVPSMIPPGTPAPPRMPPAFVPPGTRQSTLPSNMTPAQIAQQSDAAFAARGGPATIFDTQGGKRTLEEAVGARRRASIPPNKRRAKD